MRTKVVLGLLAALALAVALTALPAEAHNRGANGRIVFGRFDPALNDAVIYTVNPDGSGERQVRPDAEECPTWSPDGRRLTTCGSATGGSTRIINPDDGTYRELPAQDPADLFEGCWVWLQRGARLACEAFGLSDPSLNGLYTVRSSDGGGHKRLTSNPGGDDNPGSASPDGNSLVFGRSDANGAPIGLFVINLNSKRVKQITPTGTLFTSQGDWSPRGDEIVFSQSVTPGAHASLWVVRADGSGLRQVHVRPASACGGTDPSADGCFEPRWSPDGTKIVFAKGTSGDTDSNIYTVNADGTGLTQVTHGDGDEAPDWGTHPLVR